MLKPGGEAEVKTGLGERLEGRSLPARLLGQRDLLAEQVQGQDGHVQGVSRQLPFRSSWRSPLLTRRGCLLTQVIVAIICLAGAVFVSHIYHLGCVEHDMWVVIPPIFFKSRRDLFLSLTIQLTNVQVLTQQLGQFGTLLLLLGVDTVSAGPRGVVVLCHHRFVGGEALI